MFDNPEFNINSSFPDLDNNSLNPLQADWQGFSSQQLLSLAGETLIQAWQNEINPTNALVYAAGSIFKTNFAEVAEIAFGESFDINKAEALGAEILGGNYGVLPDVQFLSNAQMNGALGAYAKSTNTIYINSSFLTENADNPIAIGKIIVEEKGHFLDAYANAVDSPGDEGEILAGQVQGKIFNEAELIALKAEDDSSVFTINGQSVSVELASPSDFGINLNSNSYAQAGGNVFRYGVLDQCTEFAYGRALEKGLINPNSGVGAKIRGNAGQWDEQAGSWSKEARANSFVVWDANQGGAGTVGHVSFVERVNSNGSFVISEFNWNYGDGKFNSRTINPGTNAFNTAKFIHLESSTLSLNNKKEIVLGTKVDFNGDGKSDFIRQEKGSFATDNYRMFETYLSNGDGSFRKAWEISNSNNMHGDLTNLFMGDFNGDGKTDFLRQEKGAFATDNAWMLETFISNGDGSFTSRSAMHDGAMHGDLTNLFIGDFNGDGKSDFIRQEKGSFATDNYRMFETYLSTGDGSFRKAWEISNSNNMHGDLTNLFMGDFNGDGKTDFLRQEKGAFATDNAWMLETFISNGDGSFTSRSAMHDGAMHGDLTKLFLDDFDGNGRADFLRQERGSFATDNNRMLETYTSNSDGSFTKRWQADDGAMHGDLTNLFVGFNTRYSNNEGSIRQLYIDIFGREADSSGLQYWVRQMASGMTLSQVRSEFAKSAEGRDKVNTAYRKILLRDADPGGLQSYTDALARDWTLRQVYESISGSNEARSQFWVAQYFNNTDRTGSPVFAESFGRTNTGFDRNWGNGSPSNWVSTDNFSARIFGQVSFGAGRQEIRVQSDDGIRVRINGQTIIDRLVDQPFVVNTGIFDAGNGGKFNVEIDYYERGGGAALNFATKALTNVPIGNWKAEFFNNINLTGTPVIVQDWGSGSQNFSRDWGNGSPHSLVSADNFSARFTTQRYFAKGWNQIQTTSDDGVRVRIGNQAIIDKWFDQVTKYTNGFYSEGAYYDVIVDYYERGSGANIKFEVTTDDPYKGTIFGTNVFGQTLQHSISFNRVDNNYSDPVSSNKKTWLVIHGMDNDPNSTDIKYLASAIDGYEDGDQVFALDWSQAAKSYINPNIGGSWIETAASWAANKLSNWGISSSNINLAGHSLGAYVSAEIAERISGGVNRLLVFDPASKTLGLGGYDSESVNFSAHSQWSWGFYTSSFGNSGRTTTTDDAFTIGFGYNNPIDNHGNGLDLFASMLTRKDSVSSLFKLDKMGQRPWKLDEFDEVGKRFNLGGGKYEGRIEATLKDGRWIPNYLVYRKADAQWWEPETILWA
ncbi:MULTISPECIES: FG-GAP-like repeat-containing protein [Calothrix]|uniref:VCBS repeat-containing protein n=2 Tax=Calothrix TaxID=1186 RepID=A0ABR8A3R9_9CYAN|nr:MULTISPECIES: PA14 domain-containing protein [Calothrix]MBD2194224.1 VCBS repeat-containing protein [Calothrix parietina FACHB-288]MBD2225020.1 VCBS repeat-containing protein [Calothrix anomala FACHB-343]